MFYSMYLSSVCQRRQWPDPLYEPVRAPQGYHCKVRVNNREYSTEVPYATEALARDGAAQRAYMICRNFSVNDGMYPGQRPGHRAPNGVVQGLPVAIGTGRRSNRSSAASYDTGSTDENSSGSNSPRSTESGFEHQLLRQQLDQQHLQLRAASSLQFKSFASLNAPTQTLSPSTLADDGNDGYLCYCKRAPVHKYGRCAYCLVENGWAKDWAATA